MKKIADSVEQIGKTLTSGYQKIESGAVHGFERITNQCVKTLFAREGETVEEAKKRLSQVK